MDILMMILLHWRTRLDAAIKSVFTYDRSLHLIGGLITWSLCVGNDVTLLYTLLIVLGVGLLIELIQKGFRIGQFDYMDIVFFQLGASIPTAGVVFSV